MRKNYKSVAHRLHGFSRIKKSTLNVGATFMVAHNEDPDGLCNKRAEINPAPTFVFCFLFLDFCKGNAPHYPYKNALFLFLVPCYLLLALQALYGYQAVAGADTRISLAVSAATIRATTAGRIPIALIGA